MNYRNLVKAALGQIPCTLLIVNTRLVNVHTGEIQEHTNIGVHGDRIAYIGNEKLPALNIIDANDKYAIPGLVDTHLHIESSQITPPRFAEAVLPRGTTTVAIDPHEIGNVMGTAGVKLMLESSENLPLKVFVMAPTCVPSADGLETAGANFGSKEIEQMLEWDRVIGLAEIMDYNGVIALNEKMTEIVETGRKHNVTLDGHCMFLSGKYLRAYLATGIEACHENFTPEVALNKLRAGMDFVKIKDIGLMSYVQKEPMESYIRDFVQKLLGVRDKRAILFCTDDIFPDNLVDSGHLDHVLRTVIQYGYDPIEAIQGATIGSATHLRRFELGSLSPGKIADIILMKDLKKFDIDTVFANGQFVAKDGKLKTKIQMWNFPEESRQTVKLSPLSVQDFQIKAPIKSGNVKVRAIDMGTKWTKFVIDEVEVKDGVVCPGDLTTLAMFERHGKSGSRCVALAKNGLVKGAIASSVCHDSHNIAVLGKNPEDMQLAVNSIIESKGGITVVNGLKIKAHLSLPIAGLMSEDPVESVAEQMKSIRSALKELGRDEPWLLSIWIIGLVVSPSARISDLSLVDVDRREAVPLFVQF
jgi:adenine deaminase